MRPLSGSEGAAGKEGENREVPSKGAGYSGSGRERWTDSKTIGLHDGWLDSLVVAMLSLLPWCPSRYSGLSTRGSHEVVGSLRELVYSIRVTVRPTFIVYTRRAG